MNRLSFFMEKINTQFTTYVLFSEKFNKHYTGFSSDLEKRLLSHQQLGTKDWTTKYRPWKLIFPNPNNGIITVMLHDRNALNKIQSILITNKIGCLIYSNTIDNITSELTSLFCQKEFII